jgi:hypothetical protein
MILENLVVDVEDSQVTIYFNNNIHNNLFINYEYSINNGNTWNIPTIKKNDNNNYYFIITGLINDKKYHIIIRSKNEENINVIEVIPYCLIKPPIIQRSITGNSYAIISFISLNLPITKLFRQRWPR